MHRILGEGGVFLVLFWFLNMLQYFFMFGHLTGGNSFPRPLSTDDEMKYLKAYKSGCLDARNILIEHNLRLVAHVTKKYSQHAKDNEDFISIGTIGLIKAVESFKADKNVRLATYAARCIENAICFSVMHITPFLFLQKIYVCFHAFQEDVYDVAFDDYTLYYSL